MSEKVVEVSGEEIKALPSEGEQIREDTEFKTYDLLAVPVLNLDGVPDSTGDIFENCELKFDNPVWLTIGWTSSPALDDLLGSASLYYNPDRTQLLADLFIRYDSPERLLLETGESCLYPSVMGITFAREGPCVRGAKITAIRIGLGRNADSRIEPL